jgi:8-oxo-dGTP pyrophosphatase MutT (NUDIX family)
LDLAIEAGELPFERTHRATIDGHFAEAQARNPALFNGRMFLFDRAGVEDGRFVARGKRTDYATFLYWRDPGGRGGGLRHCYPVGAVVSSDGLVLVGEMAATTANAGRVYMPSGSLDQHDLSPDGRLTPLANIHRELGEEVGLDAAAFRRRPGWWVIEGWATFAMCAVFDAPHTAAELHERIGAHLAREAEPELSRIHFLHPARGIGDMNTIPYVPVLLDQLARAPRPSVPD